MWHLIYTSNLTPWTLLNLTLLKVNIPSNIIIIYQNSCIKLAHVKCDVWIKSWTLVESSTVSVADRANIAFNLIDSNVALHMHLTLALSLAQVKFDIWNQPKRTFFIGTISWAVWISQFHSNGLSPFKFSLSTAIWLEKHFNTHEVKK